VADQLGQDGVARPVGDLVSREGVNRLERKGKDERGGYVPGEVGGAGQAVVSGGERAVGGVVSGGGQAAGAVKGAVGGLFGVGGKGGGQEQEVRDGRE
jgi:hypothetical protein